MSTKIGKYIPKPIKRPLIYLHHLPSKIKGKIYVAAAQGKIYFPDTWFQKWDYKVHTGRKLNMKNPVTYQEKLQWLKKNYHNSLYTTLVDKYAAREWVAEKIGEEYLVPLYGVYDSFDDIDFAKLPKSFVLKCTHDSGSVVLCRDKEKFDKEEARKVLEKGLKRNQFYLSREWPYKNVKPRIICEQYLFDDNIDDPSDYKFFCFDDVVKFMLVNSERHSESGLKTNYYSLPNFEKIHVREAIYPNNPKRDEKPKKLNEMIKLAKTLSTGMPHVRVDFNYVNERIYFGEMTFYHCGGRVLFIPDEYNIKFGEYIKLPPKEK